jgi:hypothetical protein
MSSEQDSAGAPAGGSSGEEGLCGYERAEGSGKATDNGSTLRSWPPPSSTAWQHSRAAVCGVGIVWGGTNRIFNPQIKLRNQHVQVRPAQRGR